MGEEDVLNPLHGIVACASHKGSKTINEDCCESANLKEWKILLIADGVGSSEGAGEAAQIVVKSFCEMLTVAEKKKRTMSFRLLRKCYDHASIGLKNAASKVSTQGPRLQTTIITVIETSDSFFITYLGDGDIWLRRGDGWAIPLMIPHKKGSLLTGALTADGITGTPVFLQYSKSFQDGEMVIAGTDGVFEIEGEYDTITPEMVKVLKEKKPLTDEDFKRVLDELLYSLHERYEFVDNATIGVIITEKLQSNLRK